MLLVGMYCQHALHVVEGFGQLAAWTGYVDAYESLAGFLAIHRTAVDKYLPLSQEQFFHLVGGLARGTDVYPYEIGAFKMGDIQLGQVVMEEVEQEGVVAIQVSSLRCRCRLP